MSSSWMLGKFSRTASTKAARADVIAPRPMGAIEPPRQIDASGRIFISGTGRAGTSVLMRLLTELDCDTGFKGDALNAKKSVYCPIARAGYELDIFDKNGPKIVKSPFLCDNVDAVLKSGIAIAHIVIPVRDFYAAARSRAFVQQEKTGSQHSDKPVSGGLWGTKSAREQEIELRSKLASLIEACVRNDIPMTCISFPRFVNDHEYLYERIKFMLPPETTLAAFEKAFNAIINQDFVHDFGTSGAPDQLT